MGLKYEKLLAKLLPGALHGQWFQFEDSSGVRYCQPDFILPVGDLVLVLEAKNTWVPEGHTQIELLYKPVLETALSTPSRRPQVAGLVVCRRLISGLPPGIVVVHELGEGIRLARQGARVVWHWIGASFGAAKVGHLAVIA